jgi:hypothetical protein
VPCFRKTESEMEDIVHLHPNGFVDGLLNNRLKDHILDTYLGSLVYSTINSLDS